MLSPAAAKEAVAVKRPDVSEEAQARLVVFLCAHYVPVSTDPRLYVHFPLRLNAMAAKYMHVNTQNVEQCVRMTYVSLAHPTEVLVLKGVSAHMFLRHCLELVRFSQNESLTSPFFVPSSILWR